MLQWMGGSRRKVTTSRKSTQKRQKQYFEQKKRQKHTSGFDIDADGINSSAHYLEKPKSLDILSLLNLVTNAGEISFDCINAEEGSTLKVSPANYHLSKEKTMEDPVLRVSPASYQFSKQNRTKSSGEADDNVSPKKQVRDVSEKTRILSCDPDKATTSQHSQKYSPQNNEFSFLDLLGDEESHGNPEESQVHESHVAFSVEGLGKMRMQTPVSSPKQQSRVSLNGCPSPKAVKRRHLSNKYPMDNFDLELDAILHGIQMPFGCSYSELPFNTRGVGDTPRNMSSSGPMGNGCISQDGSDCYTGNFFNNKGCLYDNLEDSSEDPWNASSIFLPEMRTLDASIKIQPFEVDYTSTDSFRKRTSDFAFEDASIWNTRNAKRAHEDFNILESSPPHFKHLPSEKDNDFTLYGKRYPTVDGCSDFDLPTWSYFATEDVKDNISMLSEESSSYTAVWGQRANHSASTSMELGYSKGKHKTEVCQSQGNICGTEDLYGEQRGYIDIHRVKGLDESGKHTGVMKVSRKKLVNQAKEFWKVKKDLGRKSSLYEEEYTSTERESGLDSFRRTSLESDQTSCQWKYGSDDILNAYPDTKLRINTQPLGKKTKTDAPLKHVPPFDFENPVFEQSSSKVCCSHIFSTIQPDLSQGSLTEQKSLHSYPLVDSQRDIAFPSRQENNSRESEGKSTFRQTDCGYIQEEQKEISIGNNGLLLGNGKTADGESYKDTHCESKGTKDETQELIKEQERRQSFEHVEETSSATVELPGKLEINDKKYQFDDGFPFPPQGGNTVIAEKRDSTKSEDHGGIAGKDESYTVMLESYVIQLLCVQKVLKEASERK